MTIAFTLATTGHVVDDLIALNAQALPGMSRRDHAAWIMNVLAHAVAPVLTRWDAQGLSLSDVPAETFHLTTGTDARDGLTFAPICEAPANRPRSSAPAAALPLPASLRPRSMRWPSPDRSRRGRSGVSRAMGWRSAGSFRANVCGLRMCSRATVRRFPTANCSSRTERSPPGRVLPLSRRRGRSLHELSAEKGPDNAERDPGRILKRAYRPGAPLPSADPCFGGPQNDLVTPRLTTRPSPCQHEDVPNEVWQLAVYRSSPILVTFRSAVQSSAKSHVAPASKSHAPSTSSVFALSAQLSPR